MKKNKKIVASVSAIAIMLSSIITKFSTHTTLPTTGA